MQIVHRVTRETGGSCKLPAVASQRVKLRLARLLARVRGASDAVRRALVVSLLVVVYALVLPWFALALRLRARRLPGFRARQDPAIATLDRLRMPQ